MLGETGRNFAAGMSGGVAYVFDSNKSFAQNINVEMVLLDEMDTEDESLLRTMISDHLAVTNSKLAKRLINDWKNVYGQFVKVMPIEYKEVLRKRKLQQKQMAIKA